MAFLYLVVMVAANTKYSINSILPPVPACLFWQPRYRHKNAHGGHWSKCIALNPNPISNWEPALVNTPGPVAAATSSI